MGQLVDVFRTGIGWGSWQRPPKAPGAGGIAYHEKVGLAWKQRLGKYIHYREVARSGIDPTGVPYFIFYDTAEPIIAMRGPLYVLQLPTAEDVLNSLRWDALSAAPTFEEFCQDLDYSPDSRRAEEIYNKCCQLERQLRALLGREAYAELENLEPL